MSTEAKAIYLRPTELLSEFQREMLSKNAQSLYTSIWNRLRQRNLTSIWYTNAEICNRARIHPDHLASSQRECARAGLLHISPGLTQSRYELAVFDDAGAEA
jgi:hypothetical protein